MNIDETVSGLVLELRRGNDGSLGPAADFGAPALADCRGPVAGHAVAGLGLRLCFCDGFVRGVFQ